MKKHSSPTLIRLLAFTFLLISFFSCRKEELKDVQIVSAAKGGGTGSGTVAPVYLKVSVIDDPAYKINSDGLGDYVHGQAKVSAMFDQNGNFIFDTYSGMTRKSPAFADRGLKFIFDRPVNPGGALVTESRKDGNYRMVTISSGTTALQSLAIDASQRVSLGGGFSRQTTLSTEWNFSFKYNTEFSLNNTDFANVMRISPDVWEITGEVIDPRCARVVGSTRTYYYMPFKLVLTRQ
jgi:hypothetical protein